MEPLLKHLKDVSTLRVVKKGGNIFFQGEIPRQAMIIRDGFVRAYTITSSGEERVVALHSKGDVLPLTWILGETSNTLFYYDAISDTRLLSVPKDELLKAINTDDETRQVLTSHIAKNYTALLLRITGLEQSRAIEKIGFTLYYLMFRHGIEKEPGNFLIDVKLSQVMIANLVGLTRESTTKNLKILKDKKIISFESSTYTINKNRLEQYLGEDSFRDLSL